MIVKKQKMNYENVLLRITYGPIGKITLILFSIFGMFIGLLLMVMEYDSAFLNILFMFFGILIFLQNLLIFIDVLFFKYFQIRRNSIEKRWLLGKIEISIKDINYAYRSFYKISRGKIVFRNFNSKIKDLFLYHIMSIHLLGISDYKKIIKKLKKVLIKTKIIEGGEYEWNN